MAYVIVSIGVDVSAISMILVVLELALVNNVVYFFSNALDSAVFTHLSNDILVVLALTEGQLRIDLLL